MGLGHLFRSLPVPGSLLAVEILKNRSSRARDGVVLLAVCGALPDSGVPAVYDTKLPVPPSASPLLFLPLPQFLIVSSNALPCRRSVELVVLTQCESFIRNRECCTCTFPFLSVRPSVRLSGRAREPGEASAAYITPSSPAPGNSLAAHCPLNLFLPLRKRHNCEFSPGGP